MFVNNVIDYGCWCKLCIFYNAAYSYEYNRMASTKLTCFFYERSSLVYPNSIKNNNIGVNFYYRNTRCLLHLVFSLLMKL